MSIVDFLKSWHDKLIEWAGSLTFDKSDQAELHCIALYGTIIELTAGIITLLEKRGRTGIPSLFRTLLETAVELRNLTEDAQYFQFMRASFEQQWLKVLKEAKKGGNPYLEKIEQMSELDKLISDSEVSIEVLAAKGFRPLNVFERFQRANMVEEYRSLYNFLSCDAHSNTRALIARHFEINGEDFKVVYYKDEPVETFLTTIDSTAGLLCEASISIHKKFNTKYIGKTENMLCELNKLRAEIPV